MELQRELESKTQPQGDKEAQTELKAGDFQDLEEENRQLRA